MTEQSFKEIVLKQYRVLDKLGEGGMGEVYLAEDQQLGRKVALKMLAPELAGDPERRRLFQREAKAAATLNHPNIVTVHGVEEDGDRLFMVMELVQGKSLDALIPAGGLPIERFFEWAIPLSEAVAAAHQQGIVHRDLKPANIMIAEDGRLKVLDFGLAKIGLNGLVAVGEASTIAATVTSMGLITGTIPYMSPEQAQGYSVDQRTDIFSLGVLFFEMVCGRRPFIGDTSMSLIASILRDSAPSVRELNHLVPPRVANLIRRCLEKDPSRRYQSALDIRNDLEEIRDELRGIAPARPASMASSRRPAWRSLRYVALPLALGVGAALGYLVRGEPRRPVREGAASPVVRLTQLTSAEGAEVHPSLAPDGTWLAYATRQSGNWDIFRQRVGGAIPMNLTPDNPEDDTDPAVSPDGNHIAFRSERMGGGIFVMGATGESVRRITDFGYAPSWSPDQSEIVVTSDRISDPRLRATVHGEAWAVHVTTGEKRRLSERDTVHAAVSPHGLRIAYWGVHKGILRDLWTAPFSPGARPSEGGPARRAAQQGSAIVELTDDPAIDWSPTWSPDGQFIYFASDRGGTMNLWRIPVDERTGQGLGPPAPVTISPGNSWHYEPSFSRDGRRLVFVSGGPSVRVERIRFDPEKETVSGMPLRLGHGDQPHASGEWVVLRQTSPEEDVSITHPDGRDLRKLTDDSYRDRVIRISPDGRRVAFASDRGGSGLDLWSIQVDGSHLVRLTEGGNITAPAWSPDGQQMAAYRLGMGTFLFDPNRPWKDQTPRELPPLPKPGASFCVFDWSPDGRLLTGFAASPGGAAEGVWIYELDTGRYRELVQGPTYEMAWLRDSRRILYSDGKTLLLVDTVTARSRSLLSFADDHIYCPTLSPDAQWIYYSRSRLDGNIWMATLEAPKPAAR